MENPTDSTLLPAAAPVPAVSGSVTGGKMKGSRMQQMEANS